MDFVWHTMAIIFMTIPHYLGLNLVFGKGKILHFGPEAVSIVAGYSVFILLMRVGTGYPVAIIGGLVLVSLISVFFAWFALRLDSDAFGVMSIALHLAFVAVVLNWTSVTRGALGIPGIYRFPFLHTPFEFAMFSLVITTLFILFMLWVDRSSFGRQLTALAEHKWHSQSLGINRAYVYIIAFLISGVGMLITIVLMRQYHTIIHPNGFGFHVLIFGVMVVVAGKPGSVLGVTLATALLTLLGEAIRFVPLAPSVLGPVRLILFGLILFIAVYIRRDTLFPKEREI